MIEDRGGGPDAPNDGTTSDLQELCGLPQVLLATAGTPDIRPQGPSSSANLVLFLAVSL